MCTVVLYLHIIYVYIGTDMACIIPVYLASYCIDVWSYDRGKCVN